MSSVTTKKNSSLLTNDYVEDEDALYKSMCSLINPKGKQKSKLVISPAQYKEGDKELTFTLNEVYSTDGKSAILDSCGKLASKQHLFRKKIKSIGTTLRNCDISDVISIDIDPESTRLPMMCKLMIIVEGAAYERGTRVLVRDASIQVGEVCVNKNFDDETETISSERQIPIVQVHSVSTNSTSNLNGRCRSSENVNFEAINKHVNIKSNLTSSRSKSGGSLSNLNSIPLSVYSSNEFDYNYFNKELRNKMFESHLNLLEYTSIPFYQYITRNAIMKDFTNPIQEDLYESQFSYIEKKTSHSSSSSNLANSHDLIEVKIPIKRFPEIHRNEMIINLNENYSSLPKSDSLRTFKNNMKRYLNERLSRFEAEITFYNLNDPTRASHLNQDNYPLSYTYHFNQAASGSNSFVHSSKSHMKTGKSCTNLMLMQIVDGKIC